MMFPYVSPFLMKWSTTGFELYTTIFLFACFVQEIKDARNWNSPCSPYCSDITSQLPILWTSDCSLSLYSEVFVNSWTLSLDHAKVHARTSRIRCWRSSKRKHSGGMGGCCWVFSRKPTDRAYQFIPKASTLLICNLYISAYYTQTWTFNSCTVDSSYATSVHTSSRRSPSGHSGTGAKCHGWSWRWHDAQLQEAGSGKVMIYRPFKRLFFKPHWPQRVVGQCG